MTTAARSAVGVLLVGACVAGVAAAQTPVSPLGTCKGQDLRGFTIRHARLEDPFWILRWRRPGADVSTAVEALEGAPYAFDTVDAVSTQIESRAWVPDNPEALAQIHYSDIGILDCRDRQLDVVFRIVSATVPATTSTLFEWGSKEKTPNQIAGLERSRAVWQVAPEAGFDRARRLAAGGRAQATWANSRLPFGELIVHGLASSESHVASASLAGGYESATGWLRHADWRLLFDDSSTPAGNVHLDDRRVGVQISGTSKPAKGVVTRFGGILDGGRLASGFDDSQLPARTVADSNFTASKLFGGITGRRRQQSFAASYALVLGSTGGGFHGDWRKHIGDIAHELWVPTGDHRLFELEQRLTLGRLQTIAAVPATERFFGGANTDSLLLGNDWRLPINPRVRSFPTNGFSPTGIGGDSFVAYNSTMAFTIWGRPAVPAELLNDEEFNNKLQAQMKSARSTLDTTYQSDDPSFQAIKTSLPDLSATLHRVEAAAAAARSSGVLAETAFTPCAQALRASRRAADRAVADKPVQAYGWVLEMLPDGDNALVSAVEACGVELVAKIKNAGAAATDLESSSNDLKTLASGIEAHFAAIDTRKSAQRAGDDMAYAEHALGVIMNELNITSISPVFVFDAAHVGPAVNDGYGGNRFAVGGGIRFSLASTVNMTLTYAVNPHRRPGEGSGALVFAMTMRNVFE